MESGRDIFEHPFQGELLGDSLSFSGKRALIGFLAKGTKDGQIDLEVDGQSLHFGDSGPQFLEEVMGFIAEARTIDHQAAALAGDVAVSVLAQLVADADAAAPTGVDRHGRPHHEAGMHQRLKATPGRRWRFPLGGSCVDLLISGVAQASEGPSIRYKPLRGGTTSSILVHRAHCATHCVVFPIRLLEVQARLLRSFYSCMERPAAYLPTSSAETHMSAFRPGLRLEASLPRLAELPERIDRVEYLARMLPVVLGRVKEGRR